MERCNKCLLPSDFPGLNLDNNHVCNFCNSYKSYHPSLGKELLLNQFRQKRDNKLYDCIVPISGGKDSSFILYYVVNELGLKPLAINYNSGLLNEIAETNIKEECKRLNVKLISKKSRFSELLIRQILLIGIKQKSRPYLGKFCHNCETILRSTAISFAKRYNTEFIVWGSSALESGTNAQYLEYKNTYKRKRKTFGERIKRILDLLKRFNSIDNKFSKIISRFNNKVFGWPVPFRLLPFALFFNILSVIQRFELKVPFRYAIRASKVIPFSDNPRFIHFFDYIEWDSMNNIKLLNDKMGWKHPEDKEDRFDCFYHSLPNYYSLKADGITLDGINYCNFIRENKLSRKEAMLREKILNENLEAECEYILDRVGLGDHKLP